MENTGSGSFNRYVMHDVGRKDKGCCYEALLKSGGGGRGLSDTIM